MFSRLRKDGSVRKREHSRNSRNVSQTLAANALTVLSVIEIVLPGTKLEVVELEGFVGVNDDPVDESVTYFVGWVDPDAPPSDGGSMVNSDAVVWAYQQQWRSIGTVGMVLDVNRSFIDEEDKTNDVFREPDRGDAAIALCMMAVSNVTSNIEMHCETDLIRSYDQRRFADGDDWDGYEPEEVNQFA